MNRPKVAIVGSGIMGSALALQLARGGADVAVFEKGPEYPYPHETPFRETMEHDWENPAWLPPLAMRRVTHGGTYQRDLTDEIVMRVGGSGTVWTALAARMLPSDFRTRSLHGFGDDWPIDYDELEPWYGRSEDWLGVAGTDADNPWAPRRSTPYPLPPFEMAPDDVLLAARLEAHGIHMHTTPQARTRLPYQGRAACMNYGRCDICPIGARYSPYFHLAQALATGRVTLHVDAAVRRVVTDATGRARGVLVRSMRDGREREFGADVVIVAAAAIESARLLLLSKDAKHPDGLGNTSGHVGRHLVFHHVWTGHVHYPERLLPGSVGFWTAQSAQFCNPPTRGRHGGIKIEFPTMPWQAHVLEAGLGTSVDDVMKRFETSLHCRQLGMHAESEASPRKFVALSRERDGFGDPLSHVHYDSSDFDKATHAWSAELFERFAKASGGTEWWYRDLEDFGTFAHYMGTCRMGATVKEGVTDSFGAVHDTPGLHVLGLSNFVGSGGSVNPTQTGVALTLRACAKLSEQLGLAGA